jgi:hypothetical protein
MSVTFSFAQYVEDPQYGTILVHGVDCHHACTSNDPCEDNALYGSCDHSDAAQEACGCQQWDVNVSNTNALAILTRLGYPADPEDPYGNADPDDLLGRAMTGNIGLDDQGIPATVDAAPGRATVIECGVRPGYFTGRLDEIARLAAEAKTRGVLVGWA